ncbi:GNAT family N-acetyltransferase [Cohnella herbarum]|uniref:GNAT family N-acetyltransferase n=1 Tax=Cohnella herbarum TaxID=2728023 RepID=A0A7Z2VEL7_9BACL|nr:GNAT family N-acetyltransferase [Cohnella herbarum]QJD81763.1 GNAT family N-acetyltransferase [Cohnella herbarum]
MTIKLSTTHHATPVAELIMLAIQDIGYQLTGEKNEADVLSQLERFIVAEGNRFSHSCILVKEAEGRPIGMILCYHGSDAAKLYEPIVEHLREKTGDLGIAIDQEADEDEYYIDAIAVDPNFQGQGIAKQLIAAAEQQAIESGYDKIALNVDQTNEGAHSLYRKLGYVADKTITIHHKPYWHMVKPLNS